jgi:hypothetical protein
MILPAAMIEERKEQLSNAQPLLRRLTEADKHILGSLLGSSGRVSSVELARKLEIPLTTIQRRRKRLESEFLEVDYSLRLDKLGWKCRPIDINIQRCSSLYWKGVAIS